jgi:hypothetical protein
LAGEALIPRYASSFPLLQVVALKREAVADETAPPVMEKVSDDGLRASLFGTKISIR